MRNKNRVCSRCENRPAVVKGMCQRCYYATKNNTLTYPEIKLKYNYVKDGVCTLSTKKGEQFIVDIDDFEKCKKYIWSSNGNGYAKNNKLGFLHRFIRPDINRVDHINQNTFDNRKKNLREGRFINVLNSNVRKKPCPIYKNKRGFWYGQTTIEGKKLYIPQSTDRDTIVDQLSKILSDAGRLSFYDLKLIKS